MFEIKSLSSKNLTKIDAGLVGKVFYVFTAHFFLLWQAMVLSFVRQAITIFVFMTINIAFTIFHLFYCVGCIGRNI